MSKLEDMYNNGFAKCLHICKTLGIEQAEYEAKCRGARGGAIPAGVTAYQVRLAARDEAANEIMVIACAFATTVIEDMHLPSMKISQILTSFNDKCDLYRMDAEEFKRASMRLDSMPAVTNMVREWLENNK